MALKDKIVDKLKKIPKGDEDEDDSDVEPDFKGLTEEEKDHKLVHDEMLLEWKKRGWPEEDYTLSKMLEILTKEDIERINKAGALGQDTLDEKEDIVDIYRDETIKIDVEGMQRYVKERAKVLKEHAEKRVHEISRLLELPYMTRRRELRELRDTVQARINRVEKKQELKILERQKLTEEIKHRKLEDAVRSRVVKVKAPGVSFLRDQVLAYREAKAQEDHEFYRNRRIQNIEESERLKKHEILEYLQNKKIDLKDRRVLDEQEFRKIALEYDKEQKERREKKEKTISEKKKKRQKAEQEEDSSFANKLKEEEFGLVEVSDDVGGVYGVPKMDGDFEAVIDGGFKEGVDENAVNLFTEPVHVQYEQLRARMEDAEGSKAFAEKQNAAVIEAQQRVKQELILLQEREDKLDEEVRQILIAEADHRKFLKGPPRRMESEKQKEENHMMKIRRFALQNEKKEIQSKREKLNAEILVKEKEGLGLAREVAILREKAEKLKVEVEEKAAERATLPIIVGRKLEAVPGIGTTVESGIGTVKPGVEATEIILGSKIQITKNDVMDVLELQKSVARSGMESWKARISKVNLENEILRDQMLLLSLQNQADRIDFEGKKQELVGAIKRFFSSGEKLQKTKDSVSGNILWWKWRDKEPDQCVNVVKYQEDSIQLGDKNSGFAQGRFPFPCFGVFRVTLIVTKEDESSPDPGDPFDFVTIRMGATRFIQEPVAIIKNVRAPGKAGIVYKVSHLIRGTEMFFKFEFSSSSVNISQHLLVKPATFEEYIYEPLEYPDEKNPRLVVSEFVKHLRMEEAQGKTKQAVLLQELIRVKDCEDPLIDSDVVNGAMQRFERKTLLKAIKKELSKEVEKQEKEKSEYETRVNAFMEAQLESLRASKNIGIEKEKSKTKKKAAASLIDPQQALELKVYAAKNRYIERKRKGKAINVDTYMQLKGKMVEVYFGEEKKFKMGSVIDIKAYFEDGGTEMKIKHLLQYVGERHLAPWEDLTQRKYNLLQGDVVAMGALRQQKIDDLAAAKKEAERKERIRIKEEKQNEILEREKIILDDHNFERQRDLEIRTTLANLQDEIATKLVDSKMEDEFKLAAKYVVRDWYLGKGTPDGSGQFITEEEAFPEAKRIYAEHTLEHGMNKVYKKWEAATRLRAQEKRDNFNRNLREKKEREESENLAHLKALEQIRDRYKAENQKLRKNKFKIRNFNLAVRNLDVCQHPETKMWGTNYSKGERCKKCGKELTTNHDDAVQLAGDAIPAHRILSLAVNEHRLNPTKLSYQGLKPAVVEEERRILEKERREIELKDTAFLDYSVQRSVYETVKLHWLPDQSSKDGPKTRIVDEIKREEFRESLSVFGRIANYKFHGNELQNEKASAVNENINLGVSLGHLHRDIVNLENELQIVSKEYLRTSEIMEKRKEAIEKAKQLAVDFEEAKVEKKASKKANIGVEEVALKAERAAAILTDEVSSMLLVRVKVLKDEQELVAKVKATKEEVEKQLFIAFEAKKNSVRFQFRRRGAYVKTPYGNGIVLIYRYHDDKLIIKLDWGGRAYVDVSKVSDPEFAKEQQEIILMELEEKNIKIFYENEKKANDAELALMRVEEELMQEVNEINSLWYKEITELKGNLENARITTEALLELEGKQKELLELANKEVENLVEEAFLATLQWDGVGETPKLITNFEKVKLQRAQLRIVKSRLVEEAVEKAREDTLKKYRDIRTEGCLQRTLSSLFDSLLCGLIPELVGRDAVKEGEAAKTRAQIDSGIVFVEPNPMQYAIYRKIMEQWRTKSESMHGMLVSLGWEDENMREKRENQEIKERVAIAKSSWVNHGMKKEEFDFAAMMAIWKKEVQELEIERAREAREREMMSEAEVFCKAFYEEEMKLNLVERRGMDKAEQEMRKYMKELAELNAKSKYDVGALARAFPKQPKSEKEKKREDLKKRTAERQIQKRELEAMILEDELSHALRLIVIAEIQMEKLRKEKEMELATLKNIQEAENAAKGIVEEKKEVEEEEEEEDKFCDSDDSVVSETTEDESQEDKGETEPMIIEMQEKSGKGKIKSKEKKYLKSKSKNENENLASNLEEVAKVKKEEEMYKKEGEDWMIESKNEKKEDPKVKEIDEETLQRRLERRKRRAKVARQKVDLALITAKQTRRLQTSYWFEGVLDDNCAGVIVKMEEEDIPDAQFANTWRYLQSMLKFGKGGILTAPIGSKTFLYTSSRPSLNKRRVYFSQDEKDAAQKLSRMTKKAVLTYCTAELRVLELEEESKQMEMDLVKVSRNAAKISSRSQFKGSMEMKAISYSKKVRGIATEVQERLRKAAVDYELKKMQLDLAERERDNIVEDTREVISIVLHSYPQKYLTDELHAQLHYRYFYLIVDTMGTRAEIIAKERRLMDLSEKIITLGNVIVKNKSNRIDLIRKQKRYEMMRLLRSELGKRGFFPKSQRNTLQTYFFTWEHLWRWKKNIRSGFELQQSMIQHEMDFARLRTEQDSAAARRTNKIDNYNVHKDLSLKSSQLPLVPETLSKLPETIMSKIGHRRIKCKNCASEYFDYQNHSQICPYHSGEYVLACPKTCKEFTNSCAVHFRRRWSCCDSIKDTPFGKDGCMKRFHVRPEEDTDLRVAADKAREEDKEVLRVHEHNKRVEEESTDIIRKRVKGRVLMAQEKVKEDRAIVARWDSIKFV